VRRSAGRRRIAAGIAVSLLAVACSAGSDTASDDEADDLPDISVEDEESEPEPEPDPEPDPEPEPEPDPEPEDEPTDGDDTADDYDGFPIDQPVEDISVIDEAYVNEVLRVLDENFVALVRAVSNAGIDDFGDQEYGSVLREATAAATVELEPVMIQDTVRFWEEGWFVDAPAPIGTSVEELLTVGTECVSASVQVDAEPLYTVPLGGRWYVGVAPRMALLEEAGTVWRFAGRVPDTGEVFDVCG